MKCFSPCSSVVRTAAAGAVLVAVSATAGAAGPPLAPTEIVTEQRFGTTLVDPYRWMEMGDPRFTPWLAAQAAYAGEQLARIPGRAGLLARITALGAGTPAPSAVRVAGGAVFYRRGVNVYVRPLGGGAERVLVDGTLRNFAQQRVRVTLVQPSADGHLLAYATIRAGVESGTIHFVDVSTGLERPDTIERADTVFRQSWWIGSDRFVYFRETERNALLGSAATMHHLGTDVAADNPVFTGREPFETKPGAIGLVITPRYSVAITRGRYFLTDTSELASAQAVWRPLPAATGHTGYVNADESRVYLITTQPRFLVRAVDARQPDAPAKTLYQNGDAAFGAAFAADGIYVQFAHGATSGLGRLTYAGAFANVAPPYAADLFALEAQRDRAGVVVGLTAWTSPPTWFRYAPSQRTSFHDIGLSAPAAPEFAGIVADEVTVTSDDGTKVPLSIVHARGMRYDGSHPTIVRVYGAFAVPQTPQYDRASVAWIERGGVLAVAHVRGGGELGDAWAHAATKTSKHRTVEDFLACARALIERQVTRPEQLIGAGGSAGGIPIGVATVTHPELFAAMLDEAPVSDLIRSALEPANVNEFGSRDNAAELAEMYAMSAYYHVRPGTRYPGVLLTTGANDPRVPPWEVAKMAARLEAATTSGRPVLLRVDFEGGHGSATDVAAAELRADEYAFALWQAGDPAFSPPADGAGTTPSAAP